MAGLVPLDLTDTEESYYRTIRAAKLSDISASDNIELLYSKNAFQSWVKRVDIYDVVKQKANFYLDEAIVTKFTDYRNSVAEEIRKCAKYDGMNLVGQLKNIGSCQDGSKVGKMNEADSYYVLDAEISVKDTERNGAYRIFWATKNLNCEIKPRYMRQQFAKGYEEVISKVPLPDCLKHAGYKSPDYSGLRYNGPAATSQFLTADNSLLTWDMTPVFCLVRGHNTYQEVRSIIQPALQINPETMFGDMGIHLIPDSNEDIWKLSTAQMEADLLRELIPSVAPLRQALSVSKVLASEMKIWNSRNLIPPVCLAAGLDIIMELDAYLESREKHLAERLNQKLRYSHIWIPPEKRKPYNEDEKAHVSINTAAIKHILLTAALKNPEAFAGKEDKELVHQLIMLVFNTLGDPSEFSSPHAFLKGDTIPHISILSSLAPNKLELALSIKEQCRMLVSGSMTKPPIPAIANIKDFLHGINSCAVPSEDLICGEYCFRHCVNPFQHPCFDRNIHHLTTLLTALSNTCGGVIQLSASEQSVLGEREFSSFTSRLLSLPGIRKKLIERSQSGENPSWAIIAVKTCQKSLLFNFDNHVIKLWIDTDGQLLQEECSQRRARRGILQDSDEAQESAPKATIDLADNQLSLTSETSTGTTDNEVETGVQEPADFSTFYELNWDQNKKNWQETLKGKTLSHEEVIASCDIWVPQCPMRMTPDRDSIKHLFPSDLECNETILKLETQTPGFAIASKSWPSLLSHHSIEPPPNHICDILTVAKRGDLESTQSDVVLWVIVSSSTETNIQRQVVYMFIVGRTIKYRLSRQCSKVLNLAIRCMLHSTQEEDNITIEKTLLEMGIQQIQDFLCSVLTDKDAFDDIKQSIALLLLSQESPIKTCAGNQLSVKLSAQQAQTLLNIKSRKVAYVSSPPGTGKTLCGLALYRDFGKEHSVYISPTIPLLHYLRYNGCEATLVRDDEELFHQMKCGTFDNKVCVVIDESHRLRCSKRCLGELFKFTKKHQMRVFVFADNTYQSFDRENQRQIHTYIYELSMEVWGRPPYEPILTEIYRNTRKVVSFLQHAMEDPDLDSEDVLDITCGNTHAGDGIQCIAMENLLDNLCSNPLVQYLRPLLDTRYQITDIAVLLDSTYSDDNIDTVHQVLQSHIPKVTTQSSATFPREGIIIDRVETFAGLDAALCIFLLSTGTATNQDATIANPQYRVYLASRATHKAVFVVPRIAADVVHHMKFDYFQPAVDYHELTGRKRKITQIVYGMLGLCYIGSWLFAGEVRREVETGGYSYSLTVYRIQRDSEDITLLDRLELGRGAWAVCPRGDHHNRRLFVPCCESGVAVARLDGDRLVRERTLTCVSNAVSVAVMSPDTVYVGDGSSIRVVHIRDDRIMSTLMKPHIVRHDRPVRLAVLGVNVMVSYGLTDPTLVVYHRDEPAPVRMIPCPLGLEYVSAVSTDCHSDFLLTDRLTKTVFVFDVSGNLRHTVKIDNEKRPVDCAVVNGQLWVGCLFGDILIMSSQ